MERMNLSAETSVMIDFKQGEIAGIFHQARQLNEGRTSLFALKLRDRLGKSYVISSQSCQFVAFDGNVAYYTDKNVDVSLTLQVKNGGLVCRVNVKNKTQDLLEWVELLSFSVGKALQDEADGKGEIVYPYNEGCRVTNMAYRESMPFRYVEPDYPSKNTFSIFPNMVFTQFIAYLVGGKGIYLGMHDAERTTKHVDFCYEENHIKIFMRAFCDVEYGEDYAMPFDSVLRVFEGDWTSAAEIYRQWFTKHTPDGLVKISEATDLPAWYQQSPLTVAYPLRGWRDNDASENGLYPYVNAYPFLEEIAKETDSKLMALLMHWEGTAPWAPPYVWPPYGGETEFSAFVDGLHQRDMLAGLYCSGLGWTQVSNIVADYRMEEEFDRLRLFDSVCSDTDGRIASTICTAQRQGLDFCPACEKTKEIFKTEFDKLCASGIDYVQALDQNHGGGSYFCYGKDHGHTPAPGKWQQIEMNALLSSIEKRGVLFGCESAAAEPFLAQLRFSDNRYELNYYLGEPIPLYAYLYHEYVNNFMGNQICAMLEKKENNFTYRLAYSFISGDMLTVVMDGNGDLLHAWCDYVPPADKKLDKSTVLPFIKTLNAWRKKGGKGFLHQGKMVVPMKIACGKEQFLLEDGKTYLKPDAALTAAYEYGGEKAQFVVNYNLYPVEVSWETACDVYSDCDFSNAQKGVNRFTLPPLSVIMLK